MTCDLTGLLDRAVAPRPGSYDDYEEEPAKGLSVEEAWQNDSSPLIFSIINPLFLQIIDP